MIVKLHKIAIHMSKIGIYVMIVLQSISMSLATETAAQSKYLSEITVELHETDSRSLIALIEEIESETDFRFAYSKKEIRGKSIDVAGGNWNLYELLKEVSVQSGLSLRRVNESISLLQPREEPVVTDNLDAQLSISGTVTDPSGEALPGATVVEKGTGNGTITDVDGKFSLNVNEGSILSVSFVGYRSTEINVGTQTSFSISLDEDSEQLDEVVVVGYGSQVRRDVTGSIAKVKSEDLTSFSSISMDQTLQGLAPGVQVSATNGVPGAPARVMIRGTNSISSGTEPLWIIDGMILMANGQELEGNTANVGTTPQNPLSMINPNDIESIEVLKDASATAIYGNRGSGGVIIVTTKSGKGQRGTFNVNYQQGVSNVVRGPKEIGFVNGDQWLSVVDEARANDGLPPFNPNEVLNSAIDPNAVLSRNQTTNTDWYDIVLQQGSFKDLNVSASKGTDNTSYYISGQYRKDQSILAGNDFERFSGRANLDFEPVEHLTLGLRSTVTFSDNVRAPNGGAPGGNKNLANPGYNATNSTIYPWLPIYHPTATDPNGNPILFDPLSGRNPVASLNKDNYIHNAKSLRTINLVTLDYHIPWVEGLTFHTEYGYDYFNSASVEWANTVIRQGSPYAFDVNNTDQRWNYNFYLNYSNDIGENNNLSVTVGTESTKQNRWTRIIEADQLLGTAQQVGVPGNPQRIVNGLGNEIYFQGIFGRLNYKFRDRYLFGLSLRRDGTSVFIPENRYGLFSAYSAGWIISDESFLSSANWLEFLKLRVSYGQTGNSNIDPLATATGYTGWGRYGDVGAGDLLVRIGNEAVTWETTTATDVGVDFELFGNRVGGSVVYYRQDVSDMLFQVPVPISSGIWNNSPSIWQNIGDMTNQGMEFQLNAIVVDRAGFKWDIGFNLTTNRNEVTRLTDETAELYNVNNNGLVTNVGNPLAFFRMARYAGIHEQGGYELIQEMDLDHFAETGERIPTGNLIPASRSNLQNHLFDNTDKTSLPTYFGGLNSNFSYKGIDLSVYFSFSGGNYIYDEAHYSQTRIGSAVLRREILDNTWTAENPGAEYPYLTSNARYDIFNPDGSTTANERFDPQRSGQRHDKFLQKGDYLRLRSLSLGYNFPQQILDAINIQKLRVYVMANNLWTLTGFDGYDPEVAFTGGSFQDRNLGQGWIGVQVPQVKTYSFGINLGF